jgi:diguanylate cyclase (GGDEF)-like protein
VLQLVAGAITGALRVSDYVCRYGGEEFGVLLPQTGLAQAEILAQRIVTEVPRALLSGWLGAATMPITVTAGVAAYPAEAADGIELLKIADRRMYAGKEAGRNRVVAADVAAAV